jgi:hypothetical protein
MRIKLNDSEGDKTQECVEKTQLMVPTLNLLLEAVSHLTKCHLASHKIVCMKTYYVKAGNRKFCTKHNSTQQSPALEQSFSWSRNSMTVVEPKGLLDLPYSDSSPMDPILSHMNPPHTFIYLNKIPF